jgi:hypothetical protein
VSEYGDRGDPTNYVAWLKERLAIAEAYEGRIEETKHASGYAEAHEADQRAWSRLWDLDDAIIAAPIAADGDLAIKARVVALRSPPHAEQAPQDYIEKLCSDAQAFAAGNAAAAGES